MIFRAMAHTTDSQSRDRLMSERVVFVDAETRDQAKDRLRSTLSALWAVGADTIDWYNLESEFEMTASPFAEDAKGDHKLFVTGHWQGQPQYANSESNMPLLLLTSELNRMMHAFTTLPARAQE